MPYTITSNATVSVHSTACSTATEALTAALELQAEGHEVTGITDADGTSLSIKALESRARREEIEAG